MIQHNSKSRLTISEAPTRGWGDVPFAHLLFVPYLIPPEVVCLICTSRESADTFDTSEAWKSVIKASYGPAGKGPRSHRSRRQRRKKTAWRSGDGAKARLCLLWQQQTSETVALLQAKYLMQRRQHEHRWILHQAALVLGADACAARRGDSCAHAKLRLWTSNILVPYTRCQAPLTNPGIRCDRCKVAPIVGPCFRCAAGCRTKSEPRWQPSGSSKQGRRGTNPAENVGTGGSCDGNDGAGSGGCGGSGAAREGYTLCEPCFRDRRSFHPPHPFARLLPCFAESRLSAPAIYEAVCGDCSFGSSILIRPLRMREISAGTAGRGDVKGRGGSALWAVPVTVEAAAPLPFSQVKLRIAAANRGENKGLEFSSENCPI